MSENFLPDIVALRNTVEHLERVVEKQDEAVSKLREIIQFVRSITYDYRDRPAEGLLAIQIIVNGKQVKKTGGTHGDKKENQ